MKSIYVSSVLTISLLTEAHKKGERQSYYESCTVYGECHLIVVSRTGKAGFEAGAQEITTILLYPIHLNLSIPGNYLLICHLHHWISAYWPWYLPPASISAMVTPASVIVSVPSAPINASNLLASINVHALSIVIPHIWGWGPCDKFPEMEFTMHFDRLTCMLPIHPSQLVLLLPSHTLQTATFKK